MTARPASAMNPSLHKKKKEKREKSYPKSSFGFTVNWLGIHHIHPKFLVVAPLFGEGYCWGGFGRQRCTHARLHEDWRLTVNSSRLHATSNPPPPTRNRLYLSGWWSVPSVSSKLEGGVGRVNKNLICDINNFAVPFRTTLESRWGQLQAIWCCCCHDKKHVVLRITPRCCCGSLNTVASAVWMLCSCRVSTVAASYYPSLSAVVFP